MKIIITESQSSKLITEQTIKPNFQIIEKEKTFTNKKKYEDAKLVYKYLSIFISKVKKEYELYSSLPKNFGRSDTQKITNFTNGYSSLGRNMIDNFKKNKNVFEEFMNNFRKFYSKKFFFTAMFYELEGAGISFGNSLEELDKTTLNQKIKLLGKNPNDFKFFTSIEYPIGPFTIEKPVLTTSTSPKKINKPVVPSSQLNKVVDKKTEPELIPLPKSQTTPEFTPRYDDTSVYGPSKSLIGFMRGRDFIPATGKYTVGMNKVDKDLLNNKEELNKYIQNKFGQYANIIN